MTGFVLANCTAITPGGPIEGAAIQVRDGIIVSLTAGIDAAARHLPRIDLGEGYVLPGFIDTQVNGGGGVLLNDSPDVATIRTIGDAHARFGTTAFLPTLISDDLNVVDQAMRAVEQAIAQRVPGVVGIHLEGPFLATSRKGIHDATKFRGLDASSVRLLTSLTCGRTLVTLAPECAYPDQIEALTRAGVIVAAGHTDADHATMLAALAAGVRGFTHLFNAMSPLAHRAPGVVGAALEDRASFCGVIVDGHHVDPAALRIALRMKSAERLMLVSDAMPPVGTDMREFQLGDRTIAVQDGKCVGAGGTLAGSALDMAQAVRNAMSMMGASLREASAMAAATPAHFLGLSDRGAIVPGLIADLVWLDRSFGVRGVWRRGHAVALNGETDSGTPGAVRGRASGRAAFN